MDTYKEVIYEFPDDKSTAITEDGLNRNLYDTSKNDLNEINDFGIDEQGVEKKDIEHEYVIHRDITEN